MQSPQIRLPLQLETAERRMTACREHQQALAQVHADIEELNARHQEQLTQIAHECEVDRDAAIQQARSAAQAALDTNKVDAETLSSSIRQHFEQSSRQLTEYLNTEISRLEEQRKSETWILQSVLDDQATDGPIAQFERAAESFVTQKSFLDQRFEMLDEQLTLSGKYLEECHSGEDVVYPEPQVADASRTALQDFAVAEVDEALVDFGELRKMHAPHWIRGFRLWAFSGLAFVILWIPTIAVKADLLQFMNPEIGNPDWQWAGVAALIALAAVFLVALSVLLTTQGKTPAVAFAVPCSTSATPIVRVTCGNRKARSVSTSWMTRPPDGSSRWSPIGSAKLSVSTRRSTSRCGQSAATAKRAPPR